MEATLEREADGDAASATPASWAIVVAGGEVRPGDPIVVELPAAPHAPLEPV